MTESITLGIDLELPDVGSQDWAGTIRTSFEAISSHDHTGSGNGTQIGTNGLAAGAVTNAKIASEAVGSTKLLAGSATGFTTRVFGGTSTGLANAQEIAPSPAISSLGVGEVFTFIPGLTNTGAGTLKIGSATALPLRYMGQALVGGEVVLGRPCICLVDSTVIHVLNHGGGWATWTPSYTQSSSMTFGSPTTSAARYQLHGNRVDYMISASGTLGGSAAPGIDFTLPIARSGNPAGSNGYTSNSGLFATYCFHGSGADIQMRKYDGSNFITGVTASIVVAGFYAV